MTAVVVAVPARNEQDRLPLLLSALAHQTIASAVAPLRVVIVLNNTADGSGNVVKAARARYPGLAIELVEVTYPPQIAHVGSARREAMERAQALLDASHDGVLLTTDADAVPAPDWIERNLAAIHAGADLVGGKIFGDPDEEAALGHGFLARARQIGDYASLSDELTAILDPIPHDPWPRHQDHTGASLAVRASVYRAVGGIPTLAFREDLGFVNAVVRAGYRLVHAPDVKVVVSARLKGRAPGGMADCIASWVDAEEHHAPILVVHPATIAERAIRRSRIRQLLGRSQAEWHAVLRDLGAEPGLLEGLELTQRDIARLIQILAPDDPDAAQDTPVVQARAEILNRIDDLRRASDVA